MDKNKADNQIKLPFTIDSIDCHLATDSALIIIDTYRWYVNGYRYPVLEMRKRTNNQQKTVNSTTALYYPPSKQLTLCNDEENERTRSSSLNPYDNSTPLPPTHNNHNQKCLLTPESDGTHAVLCYQLLHENIVSFTLHTQTGIKVYESTPKLVTAGCHKENVNLGNHANSVYLLGIHVGEEHIYEKIVLKK